MNDESGLKPIIFERGKYGYYGYYRNNLFQQNLLLKAMQVTTDPEKLRQAAGLRTVADVYRTLDKLSIRKEYHEALSRHHIDLDYIILGIKTIIDGSDDDAIKLKSLQTLLKSLGLDKYEKEDDSGKSWEDVLLKLENKKSEDKKMLTIGNYEVNTPPVPESEKVKDAQERKSGKQLYG